MPVKRFLKPKVSPSLKKSPQKVFPILQFGYDEGKKGYRYDFDDRQYTPPRNFYDVFYIKISSHYIIMEEWKDRTKRDTWPLEVYERDKSEQSLEQRCLSLLRQKLVEWGLPREKVYNAKINEVNY